jgi:BsuBI/PstI restriction endonuclease domain/BsuBI/PstI restriction endonuclease HTH domain
MTEIVELLDETVKLLEALGVPMGSMTPIRKHHAARAFLSLAGLTLQGQWPRLNGSAPRYLTSKQILAFGREHLGGTRSNGSYDDVRREDLKLLVAAELVQAAANKPTATMNDATRGYGIHPDVLNTVSQYGTPQWAVAIAHFRNVWPSLSEQLKSSRNLNKIPIQISQNIALGFRPDPHNQLQKSIIEEFLPRFGYGASVLYVGDTDDKGKYRDGQGLRDIGMFELGHDKLPDVIAYSRLKRWLYLIEAVTSTGPVDDVRRMTLEKKLAQVAVPRIYVTAFLNRATFKKWAADIAWETEVWIAEDPDHLIHFNGDKFLGPHVDAH